MKGLEDEPSYHRKTHGDKETLLTLARMQGTKVLFAPSLQASPPEATILLVIWAPLPRAKITVSHFQGPG